MLKLLSNQLKNKKKRNQVKNKKKRNKSNEKYLTKCKYDRISQIYYL